jgi:hypothetical protein
LCSFFPSAAIPEPLCKISNYKLFQTFLAPCARIRFINKTFFYPKI